jgi:alpha-beta hydrolase superfamily lysophospholipase
MSPLPFAVLLLGSGSKPELAKLFTENGYVFFVPHRRGHGRSPADGPSMQK